MKWLRINRSYMRWPTISLSTATHESSLGVRLIWMVGIWVTSVSLLLMIAYVLRWLLKQTY